MRGAGAHRRVRALVRVVHGEAHPLGHRFQHRDVEPAALAGATTLYQRGEDIGVCIHARGDVGDRRACLGRFVFGASHGQEAGFALDQQVIGFLVAVGTISTIAGDVTDDQLREAFFQRLVRQAQTCRSAGREVLHQHVGLFQQALEDDFRFIMLDVQRQAFLRPIGPDKMRGQAIDALVICTREVTDAGALDLDDACAQIGQLARAERRSNRMFEGDDGDAVQWTHDVYPSLFLVAITWVISPALPRPASPARRAHSQPTASRAGHRRTACHGR